MKLSTATFSLSLNSSSWEDLGSCHIFPMFVIELNTIGDCLMSRWLPLLRSSNMLSRRFWSFCRWSMPIIVVKKIFWKWSWEEGKQATVATVSYVVSSSFVVVYPFSIQNSIWRVSGLFKLNFWSVSCPNSSTVGSSSRPFLYYRNSNERRFELQLSNRITNSPLFSGRVTWAT